MNTWLGPGLVLLILNPHPGLAQNLTQQPVSVTALSRVQRGRPLDKGALDLLIQRAYSVPHEFGADALLRVVETGMVPDRESQLKALDATLALARDAQEPIRRALIFGASVDSRNGAKYAGMFLRKSYGSKAEPHRGSRRFAELC